MKNIIDFLTRTTKRQELFCLYYIRTHNATLAYSQAYECDVASGRIRGNELLKRSNIQYYLSTLVKNDMDSQTRDIVELFTEIAFSSITDVCEFGTEQGVLMYNGHPIRTLSATGEQKKITLMSQYFWLKEDIQYYSKGVKAIKFNKDGSLKQVTMDLQAKFKAMNFLEEHLELVNNAFAFDAYIESLIIDNLQGLTRKEIDFKKYREDIYKLLAA